MDITTTQVLELMHIDLFGPTQSESIRRKKYARVGVEDYSGFTWLDFLRSKSDTFTTFRRICFNIQTKKGSILKRLKSDDHGKEFENNLFLDFCEGYSIKHEFSTPKIPQQNGIVERKNITIQDMTRVMLNVKNIAHSWRGISS